ncbi:uncharacterized protein N7479_009059 [Penicillium vulpinum]|uniref:non-specific serine/threonine protein kinase n=1 Tax=Penicillium vulpinum TaxID=29845 RepID=A0A1V6RT68_9EURO|nr:uncharacterized protein N7479_009059 [Penicillium vulpinum]KAJ5950646.1 hypothetical protein N7479_009059 [Penicillium vulpinum]OQE04972.1 hypothetical protein PENVUL_c028G06650 [Penicillium vulpinum]
MEGHPVLLSSEGTVRIVALGGAGCIHQDSNYQDQVIKAPLKHNTRGCSEKVIKSVERREEFSELCINREKLIYQALPKYDPNILNCLAITDRGIHLPYLRHGDVRSYLQNYSVDAETRDQWINSAIDAVATIHIYGVVHSNISPRNFLVADDFSIRLCDFAGSRINDLDSLVEEETRYRLPSSPSRTIITDIFALGSLIYEVSTGVRPFDEIDDDDEIERMFTEQIFPSLESLEYRDIISKCWRSQYSSADIIKGDILRRRKHLPEPMQCNYPLIFSTLAMIGMGFAVVWAYMGRKRG